jgi:ubiquinone/menaquinone biosynthesis C-methylase UbiE
VTLHAPATPQVHSAGNSSREIHAGALALASPQPGLAWLDIGCGTGDVLREVRDRYAPSRLQGVDIINWLAPDLAEDVDMATGPAEEVLAGAAPADRVLLIELIEHLEAPWTTLRLAARLVAPGGRLVLTTPNLNSLRHRIELLVRGQLTSFRPDNLPHLTPALPHVMARILQEEGLEISLSFVGRDIIPGGGPLWPWPVVRRMPQFSCISAAVIGEHGGR